MSNSYKVLFVVLILIVAVAVVWSVKFYGSSAPGGIVNSVNPSASPSAGYSTSPLPTTKNKPIVSVASLLASDPGPNASQKQVIDYSVTVYNASVEASLIDVSACSPNPAVVHLKTKSTMVFKNQDSVPHHIFHVRGVDLNVPANSQKSFDLNFASPGIYGYKCDNAVVGIFFVLP